MHRPLLVALLISLIAPAAAPAATVGANVFRDEGEPAGPVVFRAAPGERNRLTVSETQGAGRERYIFRDRGAPVLAQGQCRQVDAHTATCPLTVDSADVRLGDREDRLKLSSEYVDAHGGRGDDRLFGGASDDLMAGGRGHDVLRGGPGRDVLSGDPGRDRVVAGGGADVLHDGESDARAARDVFVGGSNRGGADGIRSGDRIDYRDRQTGLRIDLLRNASSPKDRITGIEGAVGGRGDDVLTGDAGNNELDGLEGEDVLRGGDGRDRLTGGAGDDRLGGEEADDDLDGGPGDDALDGGAGHDGLDGDTGLDQLIGGPGDDAIASLEWRGHEQIEAPDCGEGNDLATSHVAELLTAACERVSGLHDGLGNHVLVGTVPALHGDSADFQVACHVGDHPAPCDGRIDLSGPEGAPLGGASFAVPQRLTRTVPVALGPAAVSALRSGTALRVQLTSTRLPPASPRRSEGYSVVLAGG